LDAIAIARIDGTDNRRRRVLRAGRVKRFFLDRVSWSPDGPRLAFTGESGLRYGDRDIWTVDVGGGGCAG
jgi:Tol biopolymer transport system component